MGYKLWMLTVTFRNVRDCPDSVTYMSMLRKLMCALNVNYYCAVVSRDTDRTHLHVIILFKNHQTIPKKKIYESMLPKEKCHVELNHSKFDAETLSREIYYCLIQGLAYLEHEVSCTGAYDSTESPVSYEALKSFPKSEFQLFQLMLMSLLLSMARLSHQMR